MWNGEESQSEEWRPLGLVNNVEEIEVDKKCEMWSSHDSAYPYNSLLRYAVRISR